MAASSSRLFAVPMLFATALMCAGAAALLAGTTPHARAEAQSSKAPAHIVSVGGAVTETLFALGLGERVKAVDTTSMYPAAAMKLPKVGYLRQLSAEGVLAMRPDLVLLGEGAGPAAAVTQIKSANVPVADIATSWTPDGIAGMVETVGDAVGERAAADKLAADVTVQFAALAAGIPTTSKPTILLLLNAGTGPMLGAGKGTAAEAAILLAGGQLALPTLEGYRPLSLEPVMAADPDFIVIPSHVVQALGGPDALGSIDVISHTNAGRDGRIIIADSLYLLGFGPRTPQAIADLAEIIYPDADIPLAGRSSTPSGLVRLVGN